MYIEMNVFLLNFKSGPKVISKKKCFSGVTRNFKLEGLAAIRKKIFHQLGPNQNRNIVDEI